MYNKQKKHNSFKKTYKILCTFQMHKLMYNFKLYILKFGNNLVLGQAINFAIYLFSRMSKYILAKTEYMHNIYSIYSQQRENQRIYLQNFETEENNKLC